MSSTVVDEIETKPKCPECGSPRRYSDPGRGEIVCGSCGLVLEEGMLETGPEWRAFDAESINRRQRTGAPSTLRFHDKGLSTVIDPRDYDAAGSPLKPQMARNMDRLRKWDARSRTSESKDRNLAIALFEMDRMGGQLGVPKNVIESAALLYRKALEKDIPKSRSIVLTVAACIYLAARQFGLPRTLEELAEVAGANRRKEVGGVVRILQRELGIRVPPSTPLDYVRTLASRLNLPGEVQERAASMLREAIAAGVTSGKNPIGVAGAAIYLSSVEAGMKVNQSEVAQASSTTPVTIRNNCRDLEEIVLD
ncbi:MAG: transcription initiation factor IIB [Theionarchaea archaeon]|nr:transcription initiation factor IIB [Theionarchaea archaeon]